MALIQVNFVSSVLKRTVPLTVILPVEKIADNPNPPKFKTLYLLHGILGNYTDWTCFTRIQQYAEEKNVAVVMPSGENSFYIDLPIPFNNWGEYIGCELVEMTRKMFPLSDRREDTFIAGLSMGGYGAIRNGLKYADTFGYVAGLSSAVHLFERSLDEPPHTRFNENLLFGDLKEAAKTDVNPRTIVKNLKEKKQDIPKMYMSCGLQDGLIDANRTLRDFLLGEGVDLTYEESDGIHNWDFWDAYIQRVLDWLPLNEAKAAINSGHISE